MIRANAYNMKLLDNWLGYCYDQSCAGLEVTLKTRQQTASKLRY